MQCAIADNAPAHLLDDTLVDWAKMQQDFDRDRMKPNPYEEPETCELPQTFPPLSMLIFIVITMATLRRQFDKDKDCELRCGCTPPHTVTSMLGFVCPGSYTHTQTVEDLPPQGVISTSDASHTWVRR